MDSMNKINKKRVKNDTKTSFTNLKNNSRRTCPSINVM